MIDPARIQVATRIFKALQSGQVRLEAPVQTLKPFEPGFQVNVATEKFERYRQQDLGQLPGDLDPTPGRVKNFFDDSAIPGGSAGLTLTKEAFLEGDTTTGRLEETVTSQTAGATDHFAQEYTIFDPHSVQELRVRTDRRGGIEVSKVETERSRPDIYQCQSFYIAPSSNSLPLGPGPAAIADLTEAMDRKTQ